MAEVNEPKNNMIAIYGIIVSFALFVFIIVMIVYFQMVVQKETYNKVALAPTPELSNLRAMEDEMLHKYALVEGKPGVARIAIERAMELEVQLPWRNSVKLSGEEQPIAPQNNVSLSPPAQP